MANKNYYFKHINTASQGASLRSLWDAKDYEAYGLWWIILEMVSRFEKYEKRGEITVSWSFLARETGWNRAKVRRVLLRNALKTEIVLTEELNDSVSIFVPNWLEFQEKRGTYDRKKKAKVATDLRPKTRDYIYPHPQNQDAESDQPVKKSRPGNKPGIDLLPIYASYPKKQGKSKGLKFLEKDIKTPEDAARCLSAIESYKKSLLRDKTEINFIKHFSTFVREWRDWEDPETGNSISPQDEVRRKNIELALFGSEP